jgi:hypothetical protein
MTALAPPRIDVYALSNAIVGQAARVQAITSATFSVCPDSVKVVEHRLQSACADILPSASVSVYVAPAGTVWIAWPAGWSDARDHVPAIWSAVNPREPVEPDGEAGVVVALEQPAKRNTQRANGTNKRTLSFMAIQRSKMSASDNHRKLR